MDFEGLPEVSEAHGPEALTQYTQAAEDLAKGHGLRITPTGKGGEFQVFNATDAPDFAERLNAFKKAWDGAIVKWQQLDGSIVRIKSKGVDVSEAKPLKFPEERRGQAAAKEARGARPEVRGPGVAEGQRDSGGGVPELGRVFAGTNAEHTPVTLDERGQPPPDFQINHVRFGNEDIALPVRDVYASPADEILERVGHREFQAEQAGKRLPVDNKLMTDFRKSVNKYPWASKDMRQNLAYALDAYLKKKDARQLAYARMENKVGADAIFKDPEAHAMTFKWKDDYTPDKTVVKCFG